MKESGRDASVTPERRVNRPSTKRDVTLIWSMFSVKGVDIRLRVDYILDLRRKTASDSPGFDETGHQTCCEAFSYRLDKNMNTFRTYLLLESYRFILSTNYIDIMKAAALVNRT